MKKNVLALAAASLFALNVQAAETKAAPQSAPAKQAAEDLNLKAFNQNVGINLVQRGMTTQDNKPYVVLVYEVTNRGKNTIKNLNWASAFTINNQVFFVQEIQTQLTNVIKAGKKDNITVGLALESLPEKIRPIFANNETPIGHLTVAKQIDFTNGKKIVVKQ